MMKVTRMLLMRRQVLPKVLLQHTSTRVLSAASAPQQALPQEDVVRTAIHKMMEDMKETTTARIVSQEDLDRSLQYFQVRGSMVSFTF